MHPLSSRKADRDVGKSISLFVFPAEQGGRPRLGFNRLALRQVLCRNSSLCPLVFSDSKQLNVDSLQFIPQSPRATKASSGDSECVACEPDATGRGSEEYAISEGLSERVHEVRTGARASENVLESCPLQCTLRGPSPKTAAAPDA